MNNNQKRVAKGSALLIILLGLFPPWKLVIETQGLRSERLLDFAWILDPPKSNQSATVPIDSYRVDFGRLTVLWVTVVSLTGIGLLYFKSPSGRLFLLRTQAYCDYVRAVSHVRLSIRVRDITDRERDRLFADYGSALSRLVLYGSDYVVAAAAAFHKSGGLSDYSKSWEAFGEMCARMRQEATMQPQAVTGDLWELLLGAWR